MWNVTFEPGLRIFKSDSISFTAPALPYFVITTYLFQYLYLSRGIQFSRASLNGALTKHKNKDIKTLKLDN